MSDPTSKRCSKCSETKLLDDFSRQEAGLYGRAANCKACQIIYRLAHKLADPDAEKARRRALYDKGDKADRALYQREWRRANPERAKANEARSASVHRDARRERDRNRYARDPEPVKRTRRVRYAENSEPQRQASARYRAEHPEATRAAQRAWSAANADALRAYFVAWRAANDDAVAEYRHRRRALERNAYVAPVSRRAIYERDGGKCGICGKSVAFQDMHIDHIIPFAKGGTHEPRNVQVSHATCNLQKSSTGPGQPRLLE